MQWNDTIIALATPSGSGAIGVVRVSGDDAFPIVSKLLHKNIDAVASHSVCLRELFDDEGLIDEALLTLFRGTKSYTGQPTIEIAIHGSDYIAQRLMKALLFSGARMAEPGEFTQRAFLNGKLDLAQAEAVADIIASEHKFAHSQAMNQLRGGFSNDIRDLREKLLHFTALIELELDFGEEDVEFASRADLTHLVTDIQQRVDELRDSFALGNALKSGFALVLAGRPNAGKSTLFNGFLNEEKAIVSDIAGTTRDAIEDYVHFGDLKVRLVDTAGIREATDVIEREGIHRTFKHVEASGATLYVMDASSITEEELRSDLTLLSEKTKRLWLVANKSDLILGDGKLDSLKRVAMEVLGVAKVSSSVGEILVDSKQTDGLTRSSEHNGSSDFSNNKQEFVFETVVAKDRQSVRGLVGVLSGIFQAQLSQFQGQTVVTNARHAQALDICSEELTLILNGISQGLTGDLLSFHLRSGIAALSAITGEIDNEEVLGHIFSKFCIGK